MSTTLPPGWTRHVLRQLCDDTRLWNPVTEPRDVLRYIEVSAVSREALAVVAAEVIPGAAAPSRARKTVRTGDTLFATVRPRLRRVALVDETLDGEIASTAFCVLRPKPDRVDPRFLFYSTLTQSFVEAVSRHESGAGYPAVRDNHVLEQDLVIPPLTEQQQIAEVLATVQHRVALESSLLATTRALKQTTMQHLLERGMRGEKTKETAIGPLPQSWAVESLGRHVQRAQYGLSVKGQREGRYPILRMNSQVDGRVVFRDLQYLDLDDDVFRNFSLAKGDLLFNRTNSYELVGRMALYESDREAVFASYLIRITLDDKALAPAFVNYYFNLPTTQDRLRALASRAVGQANINATKVRQFFVPVPPSIEEQHEIADILQVIDDKIAIHECKMTALRELFETLLNELMSGRMRVADLEVRVPSEDHYDPETVVRSAGRREMPVRVVNKREGGNYGAADLNPADRVAMMWQLTRDALAFTGGFQGAESRLQRHAVRVRRRES